jgi:hypothetical protein
MSHIAQVCREFFDPKKLSQQKNQETFLLLRMKNGRKWLGTSQKLKKTLKIAYINDELLFGKIFY